MLTDPVDLTIQKTFLGEDDKQFAKAKARKSQPKAPTPSIPDGPCCLRCRNWDPPGSHDDFGHCRALVTVEERTTFGPERGTVVAVEAAVQQAEWSWVYLPTKPYFAGCSRFVRQIEREGDRAA